MKNGMMAGRGMVNLDVLKLGVVDWSVVHWRVDGPLGFRLLTGDALTCPAFDLLRHSVPVVFAGQFLGSGVRTRVVKAVKGVIEHFA